MEHKIGEIVTLPDGIKAKAVEQEGGCKGCVFAPSGCLQRYGRWLIGRCTPYHRTDRKNIIYKEIKED